MSSTLSDLELKRYALMSTGERPKLDWADEISRELSFEKEIRLVSGKSEQAFQVGVVGEIVGDAMAAVLLSQGRTDLDTPENRQFAKRIARNVIDRLGTLGGDRLSITEYDLSVLIEAVLIEAGAFEVAKSLVSQRSRLPKGDSPVGRVKLIRRNQQVVPWSTDKVEIAVRKAFLSQGLNSEPAVEISANVEMKVLSSGNAYVGIETIQDLVQEELMRGGHFKVAEAYITYRAQRAMMRLEERATAASSDQFEMISVLDKDGVPQFWDGEDLRRRIDFALIGLDIDMPRDRIEVELRRSITADIPAADLRKLIVMNAKTLMEKDADFRFFAARILLTYIYEEVLDWDIVRDGLDKLKQFHAQAFLRNIQQAVEIDRISPDLRVYDMAKLASALDPTADLDFDFLGIQTLYDRYLITDKTGKTQRRLETPQMFWMRVAMGLFKDEDGREDKAIELYQLYKSRRFCSSTPTLFNSGTLRSQLSSCYLYKVDDSIESIMLRGIAENAFLSKWAGGLGGSWTSVRGTGGFINGTNGESQGVIPFLKMHNDQLVAVNQGGKRAGSGCAYLETWHNDIYDFLELRRNTGDERRRTHDMNTANWVPDLFMKRMEERGNWTLFRSNEVKDLHDLYGQAFETRYVEYEAMAKRGEIWGREIEALELWKAMLKMLFETGHPWITFKDPCNLRSPQDHVGVIHSSNLCTEITLNTSADETAVCNLGSIVIDNHLTPDGEIDHAKLRETVRVAVRALDNVIDINFYPTEAAKNANSKHRPIGLGVMGLHHALFEKGVDFASEEAIEFNDEIMEAVAYYAYEASSDLAAERGVYSSYKGSKWDRGMLPQDTLETLERERGIPVEVPRGGKMDWTPVREKIATQGMRNSNVLAIAPTATIANIMGTSPCIEPLYKNMYVKSNLSGDFVVVNPYMVKDLKARGLWTPDVIDQVKYFDGELDAIEEIPDDLKQKFATAFAIPYEYVIDAAARRQKWIDQSQSVNLFLGQADLKTLSHMYRRAWHVGLKTTYYLRTLGASNIEKATVAVKKQADERRVYTEAEKAACSIEAMRNGEECEACQ
ncbi:MAG: ribonucleoside-diphosphate reductase subunit alpha [Armatimonadetes bacterium]|nr:ribonucleoside-diphosphate reductase subunit alpha [Armatimonadota bacterium]MBS1712056.1 ribonucleoside-diphosphate reductase subunit alpha [Armatimonadota bacterium]MBX3109390.1 ribonucleoside-diphosphate reductase subunit alpha [Fimbriimonadaceae bacterium]